jgi:hypothetical protein
MTARRVEPEFRLSHQQRLAAAERETVIDLQDMKKYTTKQAAVQGVQELPVLAAGGVT